MKLYNVTHNVPLSRLTVFYFLLIAGKPSSFFMAYDVVWAPSKLLGHQKLKQNGQERYKRREERTRKPYTINHCRVTSAIKSG